MLCLIQWSGVWAESSGRTKFPSPGAWGSGLPGPPAILNSEFDELGVVKKPGVR
jgi:hypothetical protein